VDDVTDKESGSLFLNTGIGKGGNDNISAIALTVQNNA